MFFPPPSPKKRKKCGHRKCRPKGTQVTKGQRTDKSLISLFRVAHASIHSSSSRKKRRHRITRTKKAQRILPPSRFSQYLRSRDGVVVSSERESTQKKASLRPKRKKNKQTNKQRTEAQKISKKCQRGIFQRAKRGRLLGDWRRLFTKKKRIRNDYYSYDDDDDDDDHDSYSFFCVCVEEISEVVLFFGEFCDEKSAFAFLFET